MSRYPPPQDLSAPELKGLPEFMKKPNPEVKFFSAFPPLNTVRAPKSVMERAGFEIYKPPASHHRHRRTASGSTSPSSRSSNRYPFSPTNSSAPNLKSPRTASAPVPSNVLSKNNSEPAFGGKQRRNFTSASPSPLSAGFPATPMSAGFPRSIITTATTTESIDNKLENFHTANSKPGTTVNSPVIGSSPKGVPSFQLGNGSSSSLSNKSLPPINTNTSTFNNSNRNNNSDRNNTANEFMGLSKPTPSATAGSISSLRVNGNDDTPHSPSSTTHSIETSRVIPSIQINSNSPDPKRVSGPRPMKTDIDEDQKRVSGPRPMRSDDSADNSITVKENNNHLRISGSSLTFQPATAISHEPTRSITFSSNGSPELRNEASNITGVQNLQHPQEQHQYQFPHQQFIPQTQQQQPHQYDFQQGNHAPQESIHTTNSTMQSQAPNTPVGNKDKKHMSYTTTPSSANSSPDREDKFHDALDSHDYGEQPYKNSFRDATNSFDVKFGVNKLDSFDIKYGVNNTNTDSFDMKYGGDSQIHLFQQQQLPPLNEYNSHDSFDIKVNDPHDSFDTKFQPQQNDNSFDNRYVTEHDHDEYDNKFDRESHESQTSDLIHAKEQEVEDSLQQLLSMKRELSPPTSHVPAFPSISLPNKSHRLSGDSKRLASGESTSNPIYSAPNNVKRLSTMHTDDMKIYNIDPTPADMSVIQETTEVEDSSFTDLSNEFTKVKVTALATPRKRDDPSQHQQQMSPHMSPNPNSDNSDNQFHKHTLSNTTTNEIMQRSISRSASENSTPLLPSEQVMTPLPGHFSPQQLGTPVMNTGLPSLPPSPPKPKSAPGTGPCRKCGLEIAAKEKSIWSKDNQLSGQWHRRCFSCYTCESKFTRGQSCYVFLDQPYCQIHFHQLNGSICKVCGNGVEGECLENEIQEVFHYDCLMCAYCGKLITSDYFLYRGMVLCEDDAETQKRLLEQQGLDDNNAVTKRRTRVMYI